MASLTINILAICSMHVRLIRCDQFHYGTFFLGGGEEGDAFSPFIGYYEFEQETGSKLVPLNCFTVLQSDAITTHSHGYSKSG